jgi:hypothetical protein
MVSPPDQQNIHNLAETTDKNGSRATELVPGALGAGDRHRVQRNPTPGWVPRSRKRGDCAGQRGHDCICVTSILAGDCAMRPIPS